MTGATKTDAPAGPPLPVRGSLPFHPAFAGRVSFTAEPRPYPDDDETATAQTVARMLQYAREDSQHPIVRRAALEATRGANGDPRKEAEQIHAWIRARVRFVEDSKLAYFRDLPEDAEVLIRPVDLLTMPEPMGDCDDFTMLVTAMLRALGIKSAVITIEAEPKVPGRYSHVYALAYVPERLAIDASHGPHVGWEQPPTGKSRIWHFEESMSRTAAPAVGFTETGAYTPPQIVNPTGSPWWGLVNSGINTAGTIFTARYGRPTLDEGEYIRTAQGEYSRGTPYPVGGGSSGSMLLIFGALIVVILIIAMSAGGRRNA